jgi:hypothetical protein
LEVVWRETVERQYEVEPEILTEKNHGKISGGAGLKGRDLPPVVLNYTQQFKRNKTKEAMPSVRAM